MNKKSSLKMVLAMTAIIIVATGLYMFAGRWDDRRVKELGYKDFSLESTKQEVTDELIQETIDKTVETAGGFFVESDAPIKKGDIVTFTYTHDGHSDEEEGAHEETFTVGGGEYPEEFDTALTGKKKGDDADIVLSEAYGGEILYATVKEVKTPSEDLTDEFVKSLGIDDVSTVEELKGSVRAYLEENFKEQYKKDIIAELEEKIGENISSKNEPSDGLVSIFKADVTKTLNETVNYLAQNGEETTIADILKPEMENVDFEGTEDEYIDAYAKILAKRCLVYEDIAKIEKIELTEEDYYNALATAWLENMREYPELKDFAQVVNKEEYSRVILKNKVLEYLADYYMNKG